MGSVTGSARGRGRGRAAAAVRQLLRSPGWATSAWSRCSPRCCWYARRGWPASSVRGNGMIRRLRCQLVGAGASSRCCRTRPCDIPGLFDGAAQLARHPAAAGHLPGLRRTRRRLRPACSAAPGCCPSGTRSTSPAASTARRSWSTKTDLAAVAGRRWSPSPAPRLLAAAARRGRAAYQRDRVRHGDARLRPGRGDHGGPQPGRPDRRRGGTAARRRPAARRPWSAWSTRSTCTGSRWPSWPWWCSWCTGSATRRPGGCSPRCATTTAGSACSGLDPYRFRCSRSSLSGALAAAGGVVYVLLVGGASPHVAVVGPDAVAAGHGGARRPGHAVGPAARRHRSSRSSTTG